MSIFDPELVKAVIEEYLTGHGPTLCHCCGLPLVVEWVGMAVLTDELRVLLRCGLGIVREARIRRRDMWEGDWPKLLAPVVKIAPPMSQADAWRLMEESVSL